MILSLGGWYVGNTAIIEWINTHKGYTLLKGDLHEFRSPNYLYDYILSETKGERAKCFYNLFRFYALGLFKSIVFKFSGKSGSQKKYNVCYYFRFFFYLLFSLMNNGTANNRIKYWRSCFESFDDGIVLQNPVFYDDISPRHSRLWRELYVGAKIIFVTRNPIEQYVDIAIHDDFDGEATLFRQGTSGLSRQEKFSKIVQRTLKSRIEIAKEFGSRVCTISFERFAMNSESEIQKLRDFLDLDINDQETSFDFKYTLGNSRLSDKNPDIAREISEEPAILSSINSLINDLHSLG